MSHWQPKGQPRSIPSQLTLVSLVASHGDSEIAYVAALRREHRIGTPWYNKLTVASPGRTRVAAARGTGSLCARPGPARFRADKLDSEGDIRFEYAK